MSIFLRQEYGKSGLKAKEIVSDWRLFLAFGYGTGLSKYMPGTMGTIAAVPLYWLLMQTPFWFYSAMTLMISVVGVNLCAYAASKLEVHDFGGIVWDEIAGFLITMWFVPFSWLAVVEGFLLFRFFDIIKPWPIRWIDSKITGGVGIMMDDVLAGFFAAVILIYLI